MADIIIDGKIRAAFVAGIANIAAPTVAELNLGLLLQETLRPDGLIGYKAETASVDNASLASTFDTNTVGRASFSGTMLRFKKQDGSDVIFDTLVYGTTGFVVIRRYIAQATAWIAGQKVEVHPITCGYESHVDPEPNKLGLYEVPTPISSQPNLRATVA